MFLIEPLTVDGKVIDRGRRRCPERADLAMRMWYCQTRAGIARTAYIRVTDPNGTVTFHKDTETFKDNLRVYEEVPEPRFGKPLPAPVVPPPDAPAGPPPRKKHPKTKKEYDKHSVAKRAVKKMRELEREEERREEAEEFAIRAQRACSPRSGPRLHHDGVITSLCTLLCDGTPRSVEELTEALNQKFPFRNYDQLLKTVRVQLVRLYTTRNLDIQSTRRRNPAGGRGRTVYWCDPEQPTRQPEQKAMAQGAGQ